MATTRERLHVLLDAIPESRLGEAEAVLGSLIDDHIPDDDEPYTDEDLAAIAETRDELARGLTIPHEIVKREIGRRAGRSHGGVGHGESFTPLPATMLRWQIASKRPLQRTPIVTWEMFGRWPEEQVSTGCV